MNRRHIEMVVGILAFVGVLASVAVFTGLHGIYYLIVMVVIGILGASLMQQKSVLSKIAGVVVFPHAVVNFFRPRSVSLLIKEIETQERDGSAGPTATEGSVEVLRAERGSALKKG